MTTHKELVERRFFIDHGMIHDRVTGRHVTTDPEMPGLSGSMLDDALDLLNSLTAEIKELRAVVGKAHTFLTTAPLESGYCCCGDTIGSHGLGNGHSPVDELQYHASNLAEELRATLTKGEGRDDGAA